MTGPIYGDYEHGVQPVQPTQKQRPCLPCHSRVSDSEYAVEIADSTRTFALVQSTIPRATPSCSSRTISYFRQLDSYTLDAVLYPAGFIRKCEQHETSTLADSTRSEAIRGFSPFTHQGFC